MESLKTFLSTLQFYLNPIVNVLNIKLQPVYEQLLVLLSLDLHNINPNINTPVKFISLIISIIFSFVYFMNHFICHLITVLIPLLKTLELVNSNGDYSTLVKYWSVFGLIVLYEDTIEFIVALLPFYYYLKFVLITLLLYNNFALSTMLFGFINKYYQLALANVFVNNKLKILDEIATDINNIDTSNIVSSTVENLITEEIKSIL